MRAAVLFVVTMLMLSTPALAAPQVLIDTDFGAPGKAFSNIDAKKGNQITGALPEGWLDNTNWKSKVVAEYKPVTEAGRSFMRITQTSGDGLQFFHALAGIEKQPGYYRLSFTARSVVGGNPGICFVGAPHSTVWTVDTRLGAEWRDYSYDFRMAAQPQELGLYFYLAGNGFLDLQKLKLIRLSEQDLIEEIKAKYPDAGQGNLVRLSRFPLGLQSGWCIDHNYSDGDQVQVTSDAQAPGASGAPSLRINAPDGILIYSDPFAVPWSFEPHVASLYVRGNWDGKLSVAGSQADVCVEQPLKSSGTDWHRVELTFKPVLFAPAHHLRIQGKGTLWIDGLQVEAGVKATAYAPKKAVEVSLAMPASDASSARIVFENEPLKMSYAVVGPASGARLKARLVTMYGDEQMLAPVKLGAGSLNTGTIAYKAFQQHPLGTYRLEAWVEDAAGKKLSAENEVVFYRLHRPRYWGKDAPNSFFGTHTLSTNRHLTMAKAIGCNWVRLHDAGTEYIGWAYLEAEKGKWQFRDADLQRYRDHQLTILGLLSTTPGWASNLGKPCIRYVDRYLEPLSMDDWANAVRTIVTHHQKFISTYEVWNEPWASTFWSMTLDPQMGRWGKFVPSATPSADYARLQKVAYGVAHEVEPQVTILGFNTDGRDGEIKWTRDILNFGGMDTCDAISYHDYDHATTGFAGDAADKAFKTAMGPIIDKLGRVPKPVWMTEGAPLGDNVSNGFYRYTLPYANDEDNWRVADRLARYVVAHRATGAKHEFLFTMLSTSTFGGSVEWTTLVTADGFLHPSGAAHSELAWLLEDTDFAGCTTLADGVYAYMFTGPNGAVAAVSSRPGHVAIRLPKTGEVQLLDLFGNDLAAGAALDEHVNFVVCKAGLAKLRAALGVK